MVRVELQGVTLELKGAVNGEGKKIAILEFLDLGANTSWWVTIPEEGIKNLGEALIALGGGIHVAQSLPAGMGPLKV